MKITIPKDDRPRPPTFSALVDPKQKLVASKKIQSAYTADSSVCTLFRKVADKVTHDMVRMRGTMDQWKRLARAWNAT